MQLHHGSRRDVYSGEPKLSAEMRAPPSEGELGRDAAASLPAVGLVRGSAHRSTSSPWNALSRHTPPARFFADMLVD